MGGKLGAVGFGGGVVQACACEGAEELEVFGGEGGDDEPALWFEVCAEFLQQLDGIADPLDGAGADDGIQLGGQGQGLHVAVQEAGAVFGEKVEQLAAVGAKVVEIVVLAGGILGQQAGQVACAAAEFEQALDAVWLLLLPELVECVGNLGLDAGGLWVAVEGAFEAAADGFGVGHGVVRRGRRSMRLSTWLSVRAALRLKRRRSVPVGTVGWRITGAW